MKNLSKYTISFLPIVAAVFGGLYFVTLSREPVQSLEPTITAFDTRDWKTYTSEDFGFSFQYPESLSIHEVSGATHFDKRFVVVYTAPPQEIENIKNPPEGTEGLPVFLLISASEPRDLSEDSFCPDGIKGDMAIGTVVGKRCEWKLFGEYESVTVRFDQTGTSGILYQLESQQYTTDKRAQVDAIISTFTVR